MSGSPTDRLETLSSSGTIDARKLTGGRDNDETVRATVCARWRRLARFLGWTHSRIARECDGEGRSTVSYHVRGDCLHEHDEPALPTQRRFGR